MYKSKTNKDNKKRYTLPLGELNCQIQTGTMSTAYCTAGN